MTYAEKLKDPRWQKKRLEILSRDNFTCCECGSPDKTLNVHHFVYRKGADPWNYEPEILQTLCEECHHERQKVLETLLTYFQLKFKTDQISTIANSLFLTATDFGGETTSDTVLDLYCKMRSELSEIPVE